MIIIKRIRLQNRHSNKIHKQERSERIFRDPTTMRLLKTFAFLFLAFVSGKSINKLYIFIILSRQSAIIVMSVFKLLFLFFILGSEGIPQNSSRTEKKGGYRIWNGQKSDLLPYQVQLRTTSGRFGCGGTLIRYDWVLTAKHCVVKDYDNKDFTKMPKIVLAGFVNNQHRGKAIRRTVSAKSITLNNSTG